MNSPGEVKLIQPYTALLMDKDFDPNPVSLATRLNRPNWTSGVMNGRQAKFQMACQEYEARKE
jgi:hypothetical protein